MTDQDPANWTVVGDFLPGVDIEKATNAVDPLNPTPDEDADTETGPILIVGDTVTFTYVVSNTGNVPLANVVVTDDNGTPLDNTDDFDPTFIDGDTNNDGLLGLDETWTYSATQTVFAGQYHNDSTVVGVDPDGTAVSDADPSHHFGVLPGPAPAIQIEKFTRAALNAGTQGNLCDEFGKPQVLTIQYTGDGNPTSHSQDPTKVEITGTTNDALLVYIIASSKLDQSDSKNKVWFEGTVSLDEIFAIDAALAGADHFSAKTFIQIFTDETMNNLLQAIEFHTSCSQPLFLEDQFGAVQLVGFISETGVSGGLLPTSGTSSSGNYSALGVAASYLSGAKKTIRVAIDIKPGIWTNRINLNSQGLTSVAILSSDTFDATTVDPMTFTLAGAGVKLKGNGTPMAKERDVNHDGLVDLELKVETEDLQLFGGQRSALLTGETFDGLQIQGTDAVTVVGSGDYFGWSATRGDLTTVTVFVDNSDVEQIARIGEAIDQVNASLGYDLRVEVNNDSLADIHVHNDTSSSCGDQADGVLGCTVYSVSTTSRGNYHQFVGQTELTIITGWDWYDGNSASVPTGQFDYGSMVTHELGHAVGLEHDETDYGNLHPDLNEGEAHREFSDYDIDVLEYLYDHGNKPNGNGNGNGNGNSLRAGGIADSHQIPADVTTGRTTTTLTSSPSIASRTALVVDAAMATIHPARIFDGEGIAQPFSKKSDEREDAHPFSSLAVLRRSANLWVDITEAMNHRDRGFGTLLLPLAAEIGSRFAEPQDDPLDLDGQEPGPRVFRILGKPRGRVDWGNQLFQVSVFEAASSPAYSITGKASQGDLNAREWKAVSASLRIGKHIVSLYAWVCGYWSTLSPILPIQSQAWSANSISIADSSVSLLKRPRTGSDQDCWAPFVELTCCIKYVLRCKVTRHLPRW